MVVAVVILLVAEVFSILSVETSLRRTPLSLKYLLALSGHDLPLAKPSPISRQSLLLLVYALPLLLGR
jgi:hypothetical protein